MQQLDRGGAGLPTAKTILDKKGTDVAMVDREVTVLAAAKLMNDRWIDALVVTSGECAVGIFTERGVLNRVVAAGKPPGETPL